MALDIREHRKSQRLHGNAFFFIEVKQNEDKLNNKQSGSGVRHDSVVESHVMDSKKIANIWSNKLTSSGE